VRRGVTKNESTDMTPLGSSTRSTRDLGARLKTPIGRVKYPETFLPESSLEAKALRILADGMLARDWRHIREPSVSGIVHTC